MYLRIMNRYNFLWNLKLSMEKHLMKNSEIIHKLTVFKLILNVPCLTCCKYIANTL